VTPALLHHMRDLRRRLFRFFLVLAGVAVVLVVFKSQLLAMLLLPLTHQIPAGQPVVFTGIPDLFMVYLKICTWGALFVTLPYLFWEIWRFAAPGLYAHEKPWMLGMLAGVPVLFYGGGVFAYAVVVPGALGFFLGFHQPGLAALPVVGDYLRFLFHTALAMGAAFVSPLLLVALVRARVLRVEQLIRARRMAIVTIFIISALLTPPDPFSQVAMALPLVALYEMAIFAAKRLKLSG